VFWPQADLDDTRQLVAALRERAHRHGHTLEEELRMILQAAQTQPVTTDLPSIESQITMVEVGGASTWSRAEIYGNEGR
jgi:hypothetical protein